MAYERAITEAILILAEVVLDSTELAVATLKRDDVAPPEDAEQVYYLLKEKINALRGDIS
jgi:hypothetical protein